MSQPSAAGTIRDVLQPIGTNAATSVGTIFYFFIFYRASLMTQCQSNDSKIYPTYL